MSMLKSVVYVASMLSMLVFGSATATSAVSSSKSGPDQEKTKEQIDTSSEAETSQSHVDEFLPLAEPERKVNGAYFGVGLGFSRISHKITASRNGAASTTLDNSGLQWDLSFILGFGGAFYDRYYAGIELELFKRLSEKSKYENGMGVKHTSGIGMNTDIRFGYLFPQHGCLAYVTAGFARVIGKAAFYNGTDTDSGPKVSFGSLYPTFGVGVEYKLNHDWNVRGDFKFSLTSKDDNKSAKVGATTWKFDGKPNRCAFRLSITRNI